MPTEVVPVLPPDPATYSRVFRRYDRLASMPIRFASYNVNLVARPIAMRGVVAATLFLPPGKESSVPRAVQQGWKDETKAWTAFLRGEDETKPTASSVAPRAQAAQPVEAQAPESFVSGIAPASKRTRKA